MKINWLGLLGFLTYSGFLLLAGKISASYEGCLMISTGHNLMRISFGLVFLLIALISITLVRKDLIKLFVLSEGTA